MNTYWKWFAIGWEEVIDVLLYYKADPNLRNNADETALTIAATNSKWYYDSLIESIAFEMGEILFY